MKPAPQRAGFFYAVEPSVSVRAYASCLAAWFAALAPAVASAAAADTTESVRALIEADAVELALRRVVARQPRDPKAADWSSWEALHCTALGRLGRHAALLERASANDAAKVPQPDACLLETARAALADQQPGLARARLAELLWTRKPTPDLVQAARQLTIESYVAEKRGEDAFRSMLRYRQDYQPLPPALVQQYADALIDLGRHAEALEWLPRGEEASPAGLRLRLRAGTLTPDAAITQARAALARAPNVAYWRVISEAAVGPAHTSQQIHALEHLVQLTREEPLARAMAQRLWQTYLAAAIDVANRERLLMGDDGSWSDFAARRLASDAPVARAIYAYLSERAQLVPARHNAQLQLAFSLQSERLHDTLLRVLRYGSLPVDALDPQVRYTAGTVAELQRDPEAALAFWSGLPSPQKISAEDWHWRLARAALRAGRPDAAVAEIQQLTRGRASLAGDVVQRVVELGGDMVDRRLLDAAQAVFTAVLPFAIDAHLRNVHLGFARVHDFRGEHAAAAAAYLRSATIGKVPPTDLGAVQARLLAALSLVRVGLKADARAQLEWVIANSKEPQFTEAARRELAAL